MTVLSEDAVRRGFRAAGEGLTDDSARLEGIVRRVVVRRRRRRAGLALAAVAVCGTAIRLPAGAGAGPVPVPPRHEAMNAAGTTVGPGPDATCDARGLRVHRPVEASRDGVHVELANDRDEPVEWLTPASGAVAAEPSTVLGITLLEAPGVVELTCRTRSAGERTARLRVRDPHRHYVSTALSCRPPKPTDGPTYAASGVAVVPPDPEPEHGDPRVLTARSVGAGRADVVERAGYPGAPVRSYRVRRGDQVWATVSWVPARAQSPDGTPSRPNGGWFLRGYDDCVPL